MRCATVSPFDTELRAAALACITMAHNLSIAAYIAQGLPRRRTEDNNKKPSKMNGRKEMEVDIKTHTRIGIKSVDKQSRMERQASITNVPRPSQGKTRAGEAKRAMKEK